MKPQIFTMGLTLTLAIAATAVRAETVCMPAGEMKASLIDWYGETPTAAPSARGEQLWASERTGTWTMIKTLPDGNACVLAQGDDWMQGLDQTEMLALLAD